MSKKALIYLTCVVLSLVTAYLIVGSKAMAQTAVSYSPNASLNPGDSVVGDGQFMCGLIISTSGGNPVSYIEEGQVPAAYGGNDPSKTGKNDTNACLPSGTGIADAVTPNTDRNHAYEFAFSGGSTVNTFSLSVADWGDFLPNGACAGDVCAISLTAYDASNNVINVATKSFTSTSSLKNNRPSVEYGNLAVSGDACTATVGQPGNFTLTVNGTGIARVTLGYANAGSIDLNIALSSFSYVFEDGTAGESLCASPTPTPVTPPVDPGITDVCANIDGVQTSVPADYHLDASGLNCVQFQLGGPPQNTGGNAGSVLGASNTGTRSVLGATTLGNTGSEVSELINIVFAIGATSLSIGLVKKNKSSK